jgi:hypothetical protein
MQCKTRAHYEPPH